MTSPGRRPLLGGNWKMHGLKASIAELDGVIAGAGGVNADLMILPPATLVAAFAERARGSAVSVGAQDCHAQVSGAYTGDVSAEMLKDAGAAAVIVGHSERRIYHKETDTDVRAKALAARRAGLCAIICVGETEAQRVAGRTLEVIGQQFATSIPDDATAQNTTIAYEPVWAIGTGLTPTLADVGEVHGFIRRQLVGRFGIEGELIRILYGGSVKPSNAKDLLTVGDVDGALVGGASLKAQDYLGIAAVYR
jgi:triosephosphate isomerase